MENRYRGSWLSILAVNPYKPGSREWHRFNLGIKSEELGHVESIEVTDEGLLIKGWFWDVVPKNLSFWYLDGQRAIMNSVHGPINTPKKNGLTGWIGRMLRG